MLSILALVAIQPSPQILVQKDVIYREIAGEKLRCDIYGSAAPGRKKAVAVFHGGAWVAGTRQDMAPLCQRIAEAGMVAVTFQYRLAPKHKWPSMREDAVAAVQWLRENERKLNLDTRQVGAMGASAGGHLAMLTAYLPSAEGKFSSRTQAVLNFFGPVDMSVDYPPAVDPLYFLVLGKRRAEASKEIYDASPLNFVDKGDAPTFTMHGTADPTVPFKQAERLQEALLKAKIPHEFRAIKGLGHDIPISNREVLTAVTDGIAWLKKYLRVR